MNNNISLFDDIMFIFLNTGNHSEHLYIYIYSSELENSECSVHIKYLIKCGDFEDFF
jgi:hypothetical protein